MDTNPEEQYKGYWFGLKEHRKKIRYYERLYGHLVSKIQVPKGWELKTLGDMAISEIIMGQSPPSSTYNKNRIGLPFFKGKTNFGIHHPTPTT